MCPASNSGAASRHNAQIRFTRLSGLVRTMAEQIGIKESARGGSVYAKFSSASFRSNSAVADLPTYGLQQQAAGKHGDANRPVPCGSPRDRQGSLYLRLPNGDQLQNHENRKAKRLTS